VVNANGTGAKRVTAVRVEFAWSPGGQRFVLTNDAIFVVNQNGSARWRLTDNDDVDLDPCLVTRRP
jgi:hypothetical protein